MAIPDAHVGASLNSQIFFEDAGGSFGLVLAELSDGRVLVTKVLPDTPGWQAGIAPGAEIIACAKAIENQVLPPTINYEYPDPECDLDYVPNEAREAKVDVAISNSLGFGGHNATLVVKKFTE